MSIKKRVVKRVERGLKETPLCLFVVENKQSVSKDGKARHEKSHRVDTFTILG